MDTNNIHSLLSWSGIAVYTDGTHIALHATETLRARMAAISRRRCEGVMAAGSSSMSVIAGSLRKRPQRPSLGDRLAVWLGQNGRVVINYPARVRNGGRSRKQPGCEVPPNPKN